jgi:hypothetical protein
MALVMDEMRFEEHVAVITGARVVVSIGTGEYRDRFRCAELVTT